MPKSLYQQLAEAYSNENLNRISTRIIEAYRSRKHHFLRDLAEISFGDSAHHLPIGKIFSRLIQRFHPDKLLIYQNELEALNKKHDDVSLEKWKDILSVLQNLDIIQTPAIESVDIEFEYG